MYKDYKYMYDVCKIAICVSWEDIAIWKDNITEKAFVKCGHEAYDRLGIYFEDQEYDYKLCKHVTC